MKITDFTSTKLAEFDEKFSSLRAVRRDPDDHPITDDLKADYSRAITEAYLLGLRRAEELAEVRPQPNSNEYIKRVQQNRAPFDNGYDFGAETQKEATLAAIRKEIDGTV